MRRYTTPTHIFNVPFDASIIKKVRIVYAQNESIILVKEGESCECGTNQITTKLTQEDTALFDCKKSFTEIQAHILTHTGESLVSKPLRVAVERCLDTEVLV